MASKKALVIVALVAVFFIAAVINEELGAAVLMFYFFAGMFWMIYIGCKGIKQKYGKKNETPSAPQQASPSAQVVRQSAAPQAPRLPFSYKGLERRYQYSDVNIYMPDMRALTMPGLEVGATVLLWQEKQNQYDPKAVAVVFDRYIIGYLYKGILQDMANDWLNSGKTVLAMVCNKSGDGIQIGLAFYDLPKLQRLMQQNPNPKIYKLTRTGSRAVQEALETCIEGSELHIEEDDSGNYAVTYIGDVIGYLSAQASEFVDDCGGPDRCSIFLAKTELDDNLKTKGSIYVFRGK